MSDTTVSSQWCSAGTSTGKCLVAKVRDYNFIVTKQHDAFHIGRCTCAYRDLIDYVD